MLNHILDPAHGPPGGGLGLGLGDRRDSATDADCASTALYVAGRETGLAWAPGRRPISKAVFLTPDAKKRSRA